MPCAQSAGAPRRFRASTSDGRPQRRVGVEDAVGEPLEEVRLVRLDAEVVQLDLGLGPGERRRALEGRRVAVLVGEVERCLARVGDERREDHARRRARGATRTRRRRLKIGSSTAPDRVRQRAAVDDRRPACGWPRPRPRKRARSVSYWMRPPSARLDRADVRGPDRLVGCSAAAASRAARRVRRRTRSGRRGSRRPGARRRRPAAPARARRRR